MCDACAPECRPFRGQKRSLCPVELDLQAAVSSQMWMLGLKLRTSAKISTFSYLLSRPIHIHFYFVLLETVLQRIFSILLPSNVSKLPSLSHVILSIYLFVLMVGVIVPSTENFRRNTQVPITRKGFYIIWNFCCHRLSLEPHTKLHLEPFHDGQGKVELLQCLMSAFTSLTVNSLLKAWVHLFGEVLVVHLYYQ